jgi:hypothetical protein
VLTDRVVPQDFKFFSLVPVDEARTTFVGAFGLWFRLPWRSAASA